MILLPNALVRVEDAAAELAVTDPSEADVLMSQINRASSAIDRHCHRQLRRSTRVVVLDSRGDLLIHLHDRPIHAISEVNHDITRAFGLTTVVDPTTYTFTERGEIDLETAIDEGVRVLRVSYDAGYSLPRFFQAAAPAPSTPADPLTDPVVGDIWVNSLGETHIYTSHAGPPITYTWEDYATVIIPPLVTQAALEYVAYMRRRIQAGDAGLISRDKGFSDGSVLNYEVMMPAHIAELLADEVSVG